MLGDFVGRAFGGQAVGEGIRVGDAGEVVAFEQVLVVGFGREEEGVGG